MERQKDQDFSLKVYCWNQSESYHLRYFIHFLFASLASEVLVENIYRKSGATNKDMPSEEVDRQREWLEHLTFRLKSRRSRDHRQSECSISSQFC